MKKLICIILTLLSFTSNIFSMDSKKEKVEVEVEETKVFFSDLPIEIYLNILGFSLDESNLEIIINLSETNKKFKNLIDQNKDYILSALRKSSKVPLKHQLFDACKNNRLTNIKALFRLSFVYEDQLVFKIDDNPLKVDKNLHYHSYFTISSPAALKYLLHYIVKEIMVSQKAIPLRHKISLQNNKNTALKLYPIFHVAIKFGYNSLVKLMMNSGIRLRISDLNKAIESNNIEIIKLLLDSGLKSNINDIVNAYKKQEVKILKRCPIWLAMKVNSIEILKLLLEEMPEDFVISQSKLFISYIIENHNNLEILKFLVSKGLQDLDLLLDLQKAQLFNQTPENKKMIKAKIDYIKSIYDNGSGCTIS